MKADDTDILKEFTPEQIEILDKVIKKFNGKPGGLIPALEEVQVALGCLPVSVQKRIAAGLNVPVSRVYGVVTFYSFFTMMPRGKHTVRACMGTACYVKGGKTVVETIEKEFHVKVGQTTADKLFTFETVRCIGACGLAPAVIVNEDVHGGVKPSKVKEIMSKYN